MDDKPPSKIKRLVRRVVNTCRPPKIEIQQLQSPLGRLPVELRLKIYHLVLIENGSSSTSNNARVELSDLERPALTGTCRLIAREALQYYFRHEKFAFTVRVNRGGAVRDLYDPKTKRWMEKINVWDKPVHDIVFKIAYPHYTSRSCVYIHTCACASVENFSFVAVVGDTGLQIPFAEIDGYPSLFNDIKPWKIRLQNFISNGSIWKGMDELVAEGLSLRDVQLIAGSIPQMAHLSSWAGKRTFAEIFKGKPLSNKAVRELQRKTWDWCTVACECRKKQLEKRAVEAGRRKQAEQSRPT